MDKISIRTNGQEFDITINNDLSYYIHSNVALPEWSYREIQEIINKEYGEKRF